MEVVSRVSTSSAPMQQYPVARRDEEQPADRSTGVTARSAEQGQRTRSEPSRGESVQSGNGNEPVARQVPPKPVVNAQGQKTGTIINTTA